MNVQNETIAHWVSWKINAKEKKKSKLQDISY